MKPFVKDKRIVYKVGEKVLIRSSESPRHSGSWGVVKKIIEPDGYANLWHKFVVEVQYRGEDGFAYDRQLVFQSCQLWTKKELRAVDARTRHIAKFIGKLGGKDKLIVGILQRAAFDHSLGRVESA